MTVKLRSYYGRSYFGSGDASGKVELKNAKVKTEKDNGFICSPDEIEVVDPSQPAVVLARGSDALGVQGNRRRWREAAVYTPGSGWAEVDYADAERMMAEMGQ